MYISTDLVESVKGQPFNRDNSRLLDYQRIVHCLPPSIFPLPLCIALLLLIPVWSRIVLTARFAF